MSNSISRLTSSLPSPHSATHDAALLSLDWSEFIGKPGRQRGRWQSVVLADGRMISEHMLQSCANTPNKVRLPRVLPPRPSWEAVESMCDRVPVEKDTPWSRLQRHRLFERTKARTRDKRVRSRISTQKDTFELSEGIFNLIKDAVDAPKEVTVAAESGSTTFAKCLDSGSDLSGYAADPHTQLTMQTTRADLHKTRVERGSSTDKTHVDDSAQELWRKDSPRQLEAASDEAVDYCEFEQWWIRNVNPPSYDAPSGPMPLTMPNATPIITQES